MSQLLAQWFIDNDPGAREFLVEVARMWREEHPVKAAVVKDAAYCCADVGCPGNADNG